MDRGHVASLGLTEEVDPAALRNLLDGRAADGTDLGIVRREKRRPGYDLTFSAPKSVSLLWTFGSPDVPDTISRAHDRAVVGVIDQLSRRGMCGASGSKRQGHLRRVRVPRGGISPSHQPGR